MHFHNSFKRKFDTNDKEISMRERKAIYFRNGSYATPCQINGKESIGGHKADVDCSQYTIGDCSQYTIGDSTYSTVKIDRNTVGNMVGTDSFGLPLNKCSKSQGQNVNGQIVSSFEPARSIRNLSYYCSIIQDFNKLEHILMFQIEQKDS